MLTLVLAEAEVELMPVELSRHPAVIAHATATGETTDTDSSGFKLSSCSDEESPRRTTTRTT